MLCERGYGAWDIFNLIDLSLISSKFIKYSNFLVYILSQTGMAELLEGHLKLIIYFKLAFKKVIHFAVNR